MFDMFKFVRKSTYDSMAEGLEQIEESRKAWWESSCSWRADYNTCEKMIALLEMKNMRLKAKLQAHERATKPIYDKDVNRWRNPRSGGFVKAPDPIIEAYRVKQDATIEVEMKT